MKISSFLIIFLFFTVTTVYGVEILPDSYSFEQATGVGYASYADWNDDQLVDGQYGVYPWSADLGNGVAYEWVGWQSEIVNIDFDFGAPSLIDTVNIGSVQDRLTNVVLPSVNIYSSTDTLTWSFVSSLDIPISETNNNTYQTFELDGLGLSDQYMRISLLQKSSWTWTFVDEIDFYRYDQFKLDSFGVRTAVPEPGTIFLLGVGLAGMAGFVGIRKRKK